jgi:hypothetical protein
VVHLHQWRQIVSDDYLHIHAAHDAEDHLRNRSCLIIVPIIDAKRAILAVACIRHRASNGLKRDLAHGGLAAVQRDAQKITPYRPWLGCLEHHSELFGTGHGDGRTQRRRFSTRVFRSWCVFRSCCLASAPSRISRRALPLRVGAVTCEAGQAEDDQDSDTHATSVSKERASTGMQIIR